MRVGNFFRRKQRETEAPAWRILIELSFTELDRQLHRDTIERLFAEYALIPDYDVRIAELSDDERESISYAFRAMRLIERSNDRKNAQAAYYQEMIDRYTLLRGKEERDRVMLDFLSILEDDHRRQRRDAKAFKQRWADFGLVTERHQRVVLREEMLQELCLDIVGNFVANVLSTKTELTEENVAFAEQIVQTLGLEAFLTKVMETSRRWQTQVAAFETLAKIVRAMPQGAQFRIISLETSARVMQFATDPTENVWQQIAAIHLLAQSDPLGVMDVIERRLLADEVPTLSDDLFVRRGIIEVIAQEFPNEAGFEYLGRLADKRDPSDFVRCKLVQAVGGFDMDEARSVLHRYVRGEPDEKCPQVRAQAAFEWGRIGRDAVDAGDDARVAEAIDEIAWAISDGDDRLLRRAAFEEAALTANHRETALEKRSLDELDATILNAIQTALDQPWMTPVEANWAADAWLQIVVATMPEFYQVRDVVQPRIEETYSGHSFEIARSELPDDECALGMILARLTRRDFGIYVRFHGDKARVYRGDRRRMAFWRALYELRNPNPAKRQGVRHTIARRFEGTLRAHSGILAEITQTKVPGEPLLLENEGTWRRHLPLVDDYLSVCRRAYAGKEVRLYSSFGVTTVQGPADPVRAYRAFFQMSWQFAALAEVRNANPLHKQHSDVRAYMQAMRQRFGIETRFVPYACESNGARVELRVPHVMACFETR